MSDRHLAVKTGMRAKWIWEGKLEWVTVAAEIKKSSYDIGFFEQFAVLQAFGKELYLSIWQSC